ncbi:SixA phosphatase family protein [Thiorhodovibrio frisius]|uniref:Phosphohistidine phosphatase SixA n=1 Tax=Thiorhodovibrio frisius TaxID=631362 RepID=H8Z032_9GAMM|nr:histidine phosphatase family protein [Thiorhodovibrio frisius]EIC21205.1 phosphohistidine phosphatase SixA [Thiorhodovibrio frisius]WPL23781.1 phosphohistidine phosphatase [Thiorhodovibrio frisius]
MSRELLIMRHAKSDWDSSARSDFDRPLAKRGKRDAPRVGAWLYREGLVPDLILSSPAERARATVIKVCKRLDINKQNIHWDERIYEARAATLLELLDQCPPQSGTVLLVGHNPGLESLLQHLTDNDFDPPSDGKLLPTAAIARLEMPTDWSQLTRGCANLISLTRPKNLPDSD